MDNLKVKVDALSDQVHAMLDSHIERIMSIGIGLVKNLNEEKVLIQKLALTYVANKLMREADLAEENLKNNEEKDG